MTNIRSLQDPNGITFYPRTHAQAVNGLSDAVTEQINYPVTSVNGKIGDVMLDKSDIGLDSVDNTTDMDKPISTAMQAALDQKQEKIMVSPSGNKFVLTVADDGTLSTTPYVESGDEA